MNFDTQKFLIALLIVVGSLVLASMGFIDAEIFKTIILWSFAIFAGAEVTTVGVRGVSTFAEKRQEYNITALVVELLQQEMEYDMIALEDAQDKPNVSVPPGDE